MSRVSDIKIEYDPETGSHFIIWQLLALGLGGTQRAALEDLREAAHLGVDTFIEAKLKDTEKGVRQDGETTL